MADNPHKTLLAFRQIYFLKIPSVALLTLTLSLKRQLLLSADTFANSLDQNHDQPFVGPDLDPNGLTL